MKRIMSILLAFVMLSSALEAFAAVSYNDVTDEHHILHPNRVLHYC